ncbi:MAG: PrsW family intramembrane metalloprotease, partial [Candidatus Ornithospirochaeta sp.]
MCFSFFHSIRNTLTLAAVVPAVLLLVHVVRKDKLEPEPPMFILSLVAWGIVSTFAALILERLGSWLLSFFFTRPTILYSALMYYVVVAMSEEGSKYYLLKKKTWNSPNFNCQYDAVVYAVAVSMGFALWENLIYVFRYGFSTAIVRALTAVPGHASFG